MLANRHIVLFGAILLGIGATSVARPTQSSPIAISANDKLLVNVNPEANSVTLCKIGAAGPAVLKEVKVGRDPSSVAISPNGKRVYVANALDGTVAVVSVTLRKRIATFNAGVEPMALVLSPKGTRLYVANSASNNVMVFDTAANPPTLVSTIDLSAFGTAPRALAVTDDGDGNDANETIFATMFYAQLRPGKTATDEAQDDQREGRVVAISAATNTVLAAPNPIVLSPMANTGFNSNGQLAPAPGQVPAVVSTNPQTFTTPTGAYPNQLASIAIQPGQARAYVVSTGASPNGPLRFNQNVQGLVSVFDTTTRNEITAAQTDATVRRTAPLNMNQGVNLATTPAPRFFLSNPVALAWEPDGSSAWVVVQQSNLLVRLTSDAGGIPTVGAPLVAGPGSPVRVDLEAVGTRQIAGKAPRGVAIDSAGKRAYVFNFVSRSVTDVKIETATAPAIKRTVRVSRMPRPNSFDGFVQVGAEMFFGGRGPDGRLASESWGSCIACHPQGRSDNVTWMFDAGPRQTIPLDGTFAHSADPFGVFDQRILNWSAVRDEVHDFELNTRNVSGGRGLIDDDRLFLAIGGVGAAADYTTQIEQFQQVTGIVGTTNDLAFDTVFPAVPGGRSDFGMATLDDGRMIIIGGRNAGGLITGANSVLEFNPRTNSISALGASGFTPRHSFGAAAVRTARGQRVYAIGGYSDTSGAALPVSTVQEYNPDTDSWRTVASLPTAVAQFAITVAGGVNTAEPLQLIHVIGGNTGSENAPSLANPNPVQRFQAGMDIFNIGTWTAFNPAGLTLRRNHGAATALRGVGSRIFIVGGQDAGGAVLDTVEEYLAQAVTMVATPHTSLPAPRAAFGIAGTVSTNQVYVIGGVDAGGAAQNTIFEYTIAANGPVAGPPGTPSGTWVTRGNLATLRRGGQISRPPGVTNLLTVGNFGRDFRQDALSEWVRQKVRASRAPVPATDTDAQTGRTLFGQTGLVTAGFNCASCHGGPKWTRSIVDYFPVPSPDIGLGFGNERVIGAEIRQTFTLGPTVLFNVGTFTLGGGRMNEVRFNGADVSQAINPLGANGFNIPSLLSVAETAPYFYNGLAQTLNQVLDGSQDSNGGTRHHFVTDPLQRGALVKFLRSIDETTPIFP